MRRSRSCIVSMAETRGETAWKRRLHRFKGRLGILFRDCHGSLCRKNILIFVPSEHPPNFLKSEQFQEDTPYTREMRDDRTTRSVTLVADSINSGRMWSLFLCFFSEVWQQVDSEGRLIFWRCHPSMSHPTGTNKKPPFSLSFAAWWKRSHQVFFVHLWKAAALRLWL